MALILSKLRYRHLKSRCLYLNLVLNSLLSESDKNAVPLIYYIENILPYFGNIPRILKALRQLFA